VQFDAILYKTVPVSVLMLFPLSALVLYTPILCCMGNICSTQTVYKAKIHKAKTLFPLI